MYYCKRPGCHLLVLRAAHHPKNMICTRGIAPGLTGPTLSHVEDVTSRSGVLRTELAGKRRSRDPAPDHRYLLGRLASHQARDHPVLHNFRILLTAKQISHWHASRPPSARYLPRSGHVTDRLQAEVLAQRSTFRTPTWLPASQSARAASDFKISSATPRCLTR